MTDTTPYTWRAERTIPRTHLEHYETLLETHMLALDVAEAPSETDWMLSVFFPQNMTQQQVAAALAVADSLCGAHGTQPPHKVYDEDWQATMQERFPPLNIGSFFIHSFNEPVPQGKLGLHIPAGMAFGTGEHPTTAGCLELYEAQGRTFASGLDMGCGSAILAMAVAKKDATAFLGVDIDAPSITVAQENVHNNGLEHLVTCVVGDGCAAPQVQEKVPFELVFANILMAPLIDMAPALVHTVAANGVLILSGYLTEQAGAVHAAYAAQGMQVIQQTINNNWVAAALQRG